MAKLHVRVVYLINSLGSGGAEMMLYRLLKRLDRNLFSPIVVTLLDAEGPIKIKVLKTDTVVYSVNAKSRIDLFALIRLYKTLKHLNPEILHTQLYLSDILGRILGYILKIPIIISSIRNVYYGGKIRLKLFKWTEKYATRTTIVCEAGKKRFVQDGIIPENKLQVIRNGIDPLEFTRGWNIQDIKNEYAIEGKDFVILTVGSLTVQKGHKYLIEAINILKRGNLNQIYLLIAGSGELEKDLKKQVEDLSLKDIVVFLGRSDQVPKLMSMADLFVLSSLWEGLPGVVLEAMAAGLPVVATDVGGTAEIICEGETGLLVKPKNDALLAEAIKKMYYLSKTDRETIGLAGRKRIFKYFNVDDMVLAYENLYRDCLSEKPELKI